MSRLAGIAAALAALPILVVVLLLGAVDGTPAATAAAAGTPTAVTSVAGLPHVVAPSTTAATAIAFAEHQLGKPYLFGGTGPDAFDCSGLVMMAYKAAGLNIPRTADEQWLWGPQVPASQVEPGDLVFFAGSDGTPTAPGHVGMVVDPARHLMAEAYATGFPLRISQFGTPGSAAGDGVVVGFTRPWSRFSS
jgi:cell wall-associated NlpC family hydrolase